MKQLIYICSMLLLSSCVINKTSDPPTVEKENAEIIKDKELLNVKGNVKTLSFGTEFTKQFFIFNKDGKIIAWYEESKHVYNDPLITVPIMFERDSVGRIIKATKVEVGRTYGEGVYEQTISTMFAYDSEGHLSKTYNVYEGEPGLVTVYTDYNEDGAPTKMHWESDSDIKSIVYLERDTHENWLHTTHTNHFTENFSRVITYYTEYEDENYVQDEERKYKQAINDIPQIIAVEKKRLQDEWEALDSSVEDNMYEPIEFDMPESEEANETAAIDISLLTTGRWYVKDDEGSDWWYTYYEDGTGKINFNNQEVFANFDVSFNWFIRNGYLNITWESGFAALAKARGWSGEIIKINNEVMVIYDSKTYSVDTYRHTH